MIDLLIARAALRDAVRPRRLVTAALLIALPALLGLLLKALTPSTRWDAGSVYDDLVALLVFGFTLTILSVVYGTGVVGQEVEQRTVVYLLTRPLPRWRILLAKSLVSFAAVAAISLLSLFALAVAIFGFANFREAGLGPDIGALLVGSVAYGCVFVLLGALLPRPLLYGLLFVFGWEVLVPIFPGSFAELSIMTYLHVLAARAQPNPLGDTGGNGGGNQPGGPANFLLSFTHPPDLAITNRQSWMTLAAISVIGMLLAMIVFSRREYVPREGAE